MFRRRGGAARPSAALLRNYLARAEAIAAAGGGNLWLIEPTLTADVMRAFTDAVAAHLAAHTVTTGEVTVIEGRTSARIGILPAPTMEIVLPREQFAPPASRR
jgi:hypothetical protein